MKLTICYKFGVKERSVLNESIRMLISNLKYSFTNLDDKFGKTIIFTSSVGEANVFLLTPC